MNAFLFLFSNKMWVAMAGIHKMLDRTANREDSDQQSGLVLLCLSIPLSRQEVFKILEHLPYNFQHCYTLNIYLSNRMRFLNSCGELRHRYFNVILDMLCSSHFFKFT